MRSGPVYIVKPKYIFKHPFNKYDLANPSNRQTQNQELTDYFNYGFNEDTMNIYGKLVKRFIQVLDHHKNLQYFNEPSELMRLNDEIPMDFGGFCKFHDPWIVDNETPENFHDGETLMRYFVMMIYANASRKVQYPLIQYIKNMYKKEDVDEQDQDNPLYDIIEQIGKNLQQKYQETMKKLEEKANQAKIPPKKNVGKDGQQFGQKEQNKQNYQERDYETKNQNFYEKKTEKEREKSPKKDKKSKNQSSDESDSEDSSDSSGSSIQSKRRKSKGDRSASNRKDKKKDKKKSRDRQRDRDRKKKEKKDKNKSKKVKKEKSHKRSKSRDRKKKNY